MKPQEVKDIIQKCLSIEGIWERPFKVSLPRNLVSKKTYSGINLLRLISCEKVSPVWATFKQLREKKILLQKGAKGQPIWYFSSLKIDGEERTRRFWKSYFVFNLSDTNTEEYNEPLPNSQVDSETRNSLKKLLDVSIEYLPVESSYYSPSQSRVVYNSDSSFWHEIAHASSKKLNRPINTNSKSIEYAVEEVIAELTSIMMCGETTNRLLYIKHWSKDISEKHIDYISKSIQDILTLLKKEC